MDQVIVGYGQIGEAVHGIVGGNNIVYDRIASLFGNHDVMHVCFPYTKGFVKEVERYAKGLNAKHVVIWSTVPIGTTKQIKNAVHSPVEGKHPELELSIRTMERWIGCNDEKEGQWVTNYFQELGLRTRVVPNSNYTEALKLLSTSEYGINIVFAAYKARVAEAIGMDFKLTKEWNEEYNKLYKALGMEKRVQKFVLDPPEGGIGGHCIVPNAEMLSEQFPDGLLDRIINQGEKS